MTNELRVAWQKFLLGKVLLGDGVFTGIIAGWHDQNLHKSGRFLISLFAIQHRMLLIKIPYSPWLQAA